MPPRLPSHTPRSSLARVLVPGLTVLLAASAALTGGAAAASPKVPGTSPALAMVSASRTVGARGAASRSSLPPMAPDVRNAPAEGSVRRVGVEAATGRAAARRSAPSQHVTLKAPASAATGSQLTVTGTVSPARSGLPVRLQRRFGGSWHTVATTRLTAKGTWRASTRTPAGRGWLRYRVAVSRNGALPAKSVEARRVDNYSRHTYVVVKRGHVTVSMKDFAAKAAETYGDARGWQAGHHRFVRVSKGGDFTLVMAEAKYLPSYSSVCSVKYSCRAGRYVVINQNRWRGGSKPFTGTLRNYRHMVVNHETGHWLGRHHAFCPGKGEKAPVMQQQSKGLQGCTPNAWPLAAEIRAVS
jgi:hypothetical protein